MARTSHEPAGKPASSWPVILSGLAGSGRGSSRRRRSCLPSVPGASSWRARFPCSRVGAARCPAWTRHTLGGVCRDDRGSIGCPHRASYRPGRRPAARAIPAGGKAGTAAAGRAYRRAALGGTARYIRKSSRASPAPPSRRAARVGAGRRPWTELATVRGGGRDCEPHRRIRPRQQADHRGRDDRGASDSRRARRRQPRRRSIKQAEQPRCAIGCRVASLRVGEYVKGGVHLFKKYSPRTSDPFLVHPCILGDTHHINLRGFDCRA